MSRSTLTAIAVAGSSRPTAASTYRRLMGFVGALLDPYEVTSTEDTVHVRAVLRRHDGSRRGRFEASMIARLPGLLYASFGRWMHGFIAYTPVDDDATWIFARYFVDIPIVGKLFAWLSLLAEFKIVQPEDRRMLASTTPRAPDVRSYKLVRADLGIARWHQLIARTARLEAAPTDPETPRIEASA
jgi:hypothetical protein